MTTRSAAPASDTLSTPRLLAVFIGLVIARLLWASSIGPSDGELLAWATRTFASPFPAPLGVVSVVAPGVALFGDHPGALRLGFVLLAAAPVLLVGRRPAAVALAATLPVLTVPGALATPAAPLAALWLGAWRLAPRHPLWSGLLAGFGAAFHPTGVLVAAPAVLRTSGRLKLLATAALGALPFVPGSIWTTALSPTGELSPMGLGVGALVLGGPLLMLGLGAQLFRPGPHRLVALSVCASVGVMVGMGAPAPVLAGPLALAILAVVPESGTPHRIAWHAVGTSAILSVALAALLRFPLAPLPTDPRARFVDTATLAQSVEAWDIDTVYALSPADVARLRWHGLKATTPPPVHPLDLPDDIVLVMPQSADPDLPFHMGWDHDRDGPHTVVVSIGTTDPTHDRPAAAWSVSAWTRPTERRQHP